MASAASLAERLWQTIEDSLDQLRHGDRFLKAQAAILGTWAAISIATVLALLLTGGNGNELGAEVRAEAAVGGPVLLVTNTSATTWTDITYTVNDVYLARQAALSPGDHATLPIRRFRKGGAAGKKAPRDLAPRSLSVRCEQGQYRTSLNVTASLDSASGVP